MQSFYKEIVLDHYQRPRNRGELENADLEEHLNNPLCGDEVTVYANLHEDKVADIDRQSRRLHQAVPHSTFRSVPDAGHMVHYAAPEAVLSAVELVSGRAGTGSTGKAGSA